MTLKEALDALTTLASTAGIDPAVARGEGESLAATVAEPARGAYVDWCTETGHATAEDFTTAASRGRRYRVAQTPAMASLASSGSVHAAAYAQALIAHGQFLQAKFGSPTDGPDLNLGSP